MFQNVFVYTLPEIDCETSLNSILGTMHLSMWIPMRILTEYTVSKSPPCYNLYTTILSTVGHSQYIIIFIYYQYPSNIAIHYCHIIFHCYNSLLFLHLLMSESIVRVPCVVRWTTVWIPWVAWEGSHWQVHYKVSII